MAFIFNATAGSATANSYVSVEYANDFFAAHLDSSYWTTLPLAKKQAALVQATNRIDRERFGGQPTNRTIQRLQFPRLYLLTRDTQTSPDATFESQGFYYRDPNSIPTEVQLATCEMALYLLKQNAGDFSIDDNDLETLTSYKVGPLDLGIKDGIKADRLPSTVVQYLKALGDNGWMAGQSLRFTA